MAATGYTHLIAPLTSHSPLHVEAWMRLQYGTLDHLDRDTFAREVRIANACIEQNGVDESEALARTYGLGTEARS